MINKPAKDESGAVMLEFALVFPIMLLIVFSGIEYSRCFRNMQMAASLSREAASVAYRDCASDLPGDQLDHCIRTAREDIEKLASNLNEGSKIVISVYGRDSGTMDRLSISPSIGTDLGQVGDDGSGVYTQYVDHDNDPLTAPVNSGSDLDNLYFDYTRFNLQGSGIAGISDNNIINGHRRIVVAEAWVPFQALLPGYASITNFFSDNFYDATVL